MLTLSRFVLGHKLIVTLLWVGLTVAGFASISASVNSLSQQFSGSSGREGFKANRVISQQFGNGGNVTPYVIATKLPAGVTATSADLQKQFAAYVDAAARRVPGSRVVSYASTRNALFIAGQTTFALVYPRQDRNGKDPVSGARTSLLTAISGETVAGAPLALTSIDALSNDTGGGGGTGVLTEVLLGGLGALIVLAFVFASFLAVIPMIMAVVAIPTAFLLVWPIASITTVSVVVEFLIALVGLGVAIDYALLIVLRWREERLKGVDNDQAIENAMVTAGHSVVLSGTTVAIGLLAMVVIPVSFLQSMAFGGLLIPLVSVAVAITLLPVVLATVGPKLDWPKLRHEDRLSRPWAAWATAIVKYKWASIASAGAVLVLLLVVAAGIHLGDPQANALGKAGPAKTTLHTLEKAGIGDGVLTPFEVLVHGRNPAPIATRLAAVDGVRGAVAPPDKAWRRGSESLIAVVPTSDGGSNAARDTLTRIRAVTHTYPSGAVTVGGSPADNADFIAAVYGNVPLMLALISLVTFVLLARAFRSPVLALKAVVLNVVSVASTWGALVLIWQDGHGANLFYGLSATGGISAFIPIIVFAFLYGLSMDYEVFILSRIREEYLATGSTDTAVIRGISRTGRLVTSAALILFLAFLALGSAPETQIKILASGFAIGILLDATIVRAFLVPALVSAFGDWNWWMPEIARKLLRLPEERTPHEVAVLQPQPRPIS